ncbi:MULTISPECIES: hypothetical protein [Stenotrophomonas]|jgi:hypothetical protein|uniref:hypothetical protein n=1 Tax=Stenotrophomonas sp. PS02300 TaxID=2991426 RepID=UPI00249BE3F0|nr:hypothetical protein [Stenotrophomonas sp. PS02300]HDS0924192.1 hypothetical protein [Stenotrophomonas maltophilia]
MPDAPPFVVRSFEANYAASGSVERILSLTVDCSCGTTSSCGSSQLIHLPGGALFRCERCGSHQAISHARLDASSAPAPMLRTPAALRAAAPVVTLRS